MGIKTAIHPSQLPEKYRHHKLIPTTDGVMATTYLLDNSYVLKLFEYDIHSEILKNEITLLSKLNNLPVPKVIDQFNIAENKVIIYTQIQGSSISQPDIHHIKEVALFLKAFHIQSKNIVISCKKRFQRVQLKQHIDSADNPSLLKYFHAIELTLKCEGVIHGDLFPDNCKFKTDKISGVYDFSDICLGDFHFDLAVIAVGWCFEKESLNRQKVKVLLKNYGSSIDDTKFTLYIKYALLYYATTRFIAGRDYHILLKRLEKLS
jgi:homoserine kinase type II